MHMQRVIVERKWLAAHDVMAFSLVQPSGMLLPEFTAGAHITVRVVAPGQPSLLRAYSLCNGPGERQHYVLGIKREPASRGGSAAMHDTLNIGDLLEISAPQNHFPLVSGATSHLLLGAGIGITPLLAMAQQLEADHVDYALHYFVRGPEHIVFKDRLEAAEAAGRIHFHLNLDYAAVERQLVTLLAAAPAGCHAYACGPSAFMEAVRRKGEPAWGSDRLHFEHFQTTTPTARSVDTPFELHLVKSGLRCTVGANETIVAAAARIGCTVETSCEQGVCGTCLTQVRAGHPDHRDAYLTDAERAANDQMLVCVGRAHSAVLELDL